MLADQNFRQWSSNRENYFSRNSPVHSAFIIIHPAPKPFPPTPFFAARDSHMHEFGGSLLCHSVVRSDHSLQAYCSAQYSFNSFPAKPLASCSYVELYLGGYVDSFQVLQTMEWPCRGGLESTPKTRWALGVFSTIFTTFTDKKNRE